jgi:FecR protein
MVRFQKILFLFSIFFIIFTSSVFSQVAKIVEIKGEVKVKQKKETAFKPAKIDTYLQRKAQVKVGGNSFCRIAFDENLTNIITIQENSHIHIEGLLPGEVFMPRGRVFSLIEDLVLIRSFKVRTPVAVAGVRGTGDTVETDGREIEVKCFEGTLYVHTLNKRGKIAVKEDLHQGEGLRAESGGKIKDLFKVSDADTYEWIRFKNDILTLKRKLGLDNQAGQPSLDVYNKKSYYIDPRSIRGSLDGRNPYDNDGNPYYDSQIGKKAVGYKPPKKDKKKVDTNLTHDNIIGKIDESAEKSANEEIAEDIYDQRSSDIDAFQKDETHK